MLAFCWSTSVTFGQKEQIAEAPALTPHPACFFAGRDAHFRYFADQQANVPARVEWSLTANSRRLTRGSSQTKVDEENPLRYDVALPMPPLRAGLSQPVELQMSWTANGQQHNENRLLTLYSADPFENQQAFLEAAKIKLYDPDNQTAELLDEHDIPHTRLLNLAAIDLVTKGIVVVGEGVSFHEERQLAETLLRAAQRGASVLCLAPAEGDFPLAVENGDRLVHPTQLLLADVQHVRKYDKQFDLLTPVASLSLESRRDAVVIRASREQDRQSARENPSLGMSWLLLEYPNRKSGAPPGKLVVSGVGFVSQWEASPVPRYLLLRLLHELSGNSDFNSSTEEKQNETSIQR